MKKKMLMFTPALALGIVALTAGPAMANQSGAMANASGSYGGPLNEINNSGARGEAWVEVNGSSATVTLTASGLAETFNGNPYPHVQHIHGAAGGECPPASADSNGDGIISTTEGAPSYGGILTTLSVGAADKSPNGGLDLASAPSGSTINYNETFELDQATRDSLAAGTAVVVVHGLDPATQPASGTSPSDLAPELPLAATSPALCGPLQVMPAGGVATGIESGSTGATGSGVDTGMLALGGMAAAAAAGGAFLVRRRVVAGR